MSIILGLLALMGTAEAAGERLSLSFGLAGFGAQSSGGVLGAGYFSVKPLDRLMLDFGGRTGALLGPGREVTGVNASARVFVHDNVFLRTGFVHQHETLFEDFLADPLRSAIGSGNAIGHRSGLELGLGSRATLPAVSTSGVHVGVAALATWFPDDAGPKLYGVLEALVSIDLGRPKS